MAPGGPYNVLSRIASFTGLQMPYAAIPGVSAVLTEPPLTGSIAVPGMSQPFQTGGVLDQVATAQSAAPGPIVPVLGPVQDPRVNGQSALAPLTGVSTTPTLSWQPPAIGAPTGYVVWVNGIEGMMQTIVTFLYTTDTSVTLPPCVLVEGSAYFFTITAVMTNGSLLAWPHLSSTQGASVDAITSVVTP
jgi:hypothetical protein